MSEKLITKHLDIQTKDGLCDSYIAYPASSGKFPAVILYMDAYGLRDYLFEMTNRLASHGYFVLTPNLLYRDKKSPITNAHFPLKKEDVPAVHAVVMPLVANYTADKANQDAQDFVQFLKSQPEVRRGKFGVTGYCMGGRMALRTAAICANDIAAAGSFHASRVIIPNDPGSTNLLFPKITAEIYLAHADHDQGMPPEQIAEVEKQLGALGVKFHSEVYKEALHGFTQADLPPYNQEATEKHWRELLSLLKRTIN